MHPATTLKGALLSLFYSVSNAIDLVIKVDFFHEMLHIFISSSFHLAYNSACRMFAEIFCNKRSHFSIWVP